MSVIGIRGTLSNFNHDGSLAGKFFGKSGTLTGVRSLSGYIIDNREKTIISILTEDVVSPDLLLSRIISIVKSDSIC